jgi:leucine dehydrogenase
MNVFSSLIKRGHEQVVFFNYPEAGLKAVVAIHNTVLGPALGGCRLRMYEDENKAIDDALRLSEGMTYKSSIAGLDLGGGKSVIIADPKISGEQRKQLFVQFAKCLNHLGGRYITAEDMGTSVADVMLMRETTKYAAGFAEEQGGGGDPSPWTALGCFGGIQAAAEKAFGSKELKGRKVALQGVGHVGMYLLKHLRDAGAVVTVSDTVDSLVQRAVSEFGAKSVSIDQIYDVDCDIYAPCAAGQTVNPDTLKRLKCKVIAGAANNQLLDSSVYETITKKGIVYAPDFVINAGGVISVGAEYIPGGWARPWVENKVLNIGNTVMKVLVESEKRNKFPEVVAVELAKERVQATREKQAR